MLSFLAPLKSYLGLALGAVAAGLIIWAVWERGDAAAARAEAIQALSERDAALATNVTLHQTIVRMNAFHAQALAAISEDQQRAVRVTLQVAPIKRMIDAAPKDMDGPVAPVLRDTILCLRALAAGGDLPRPDCAAAGSGTAAGVPASAP